MNRRQFFEKAGVSAASFGVLGSRFSRGSQPGPRLKLGLIGCGGRGTWIAGLFAKHGGFEISAAADYFEDRAGEFGEKFSLPRTQVFSGLSGYRRLLEAGVEAVAIESPPYFHPAQAAAAVDAGIHVYLAKPAAIDVPGCRAVAEAGKEATSRKLVFLVDFQTRANPAFIEAVRRVREGGLGDIVFAEATYHADCPFEQWYDLMTADSSNPESRLHAWGLDRALSGDIITEQEIHTLDVVSWIMGTPPVSALGTGGLKARPKIGTCWDHFVVYFQYPGKVGVQFSGRQFKGHGTVEGIRNRTFGSKGVLETEYGGLVLLRGENYWNGGKTADIYESGAVANIAAFHAAIVKGDYANPTVGPSVESNLITILGRKAAYENRLVTWDEILNDKERLDPALNSLRD
jgi:predicted dehydrogenase